MLDPVIGPIEYQSQIKHSNLCHVNTLFLLLKGGSRVAQGDLKPEIRRLFQRYLTEQQFEVIESQDRTPVLGAQFKTDVCGIVNNDLPCIEIFLTSGDNKPLWAFQSPHRITEETLDETLSVISQQLRYDVHHAHSFLKGDTTCPQQKSNP